MTEKTFIHHGGALGDALLSLPCIGRIKGGAGRIHFAGRPDVAELLKISKIAEDASSADDLIYASLYTGSPDAPAKEYLSAFDRAFVFTVKSDSPFVAGIATCIPDTRTISTIPPDGVKVHVAQFRLDQTAGGAVDSLPALTLPVIHSHRARELIARTGNAAGTGPLMTVHPGSGGRKKCWPLEKYFDLMRRLVHDHAFSIAVVSGPAEDYETITKIDRFVQGHPGVIHVRNENLAAVAALINMSRVYAGNDSGITHLAAAVNGNVVALFGPTDPLLWKPLGRRVQVVSAGSPGGEPSAITVDEVYARVMSLLRGEERKRTDVQETEGKVSARELIKYTGHFTG